MRDLRHLDAQLWTVAIEDPEFAFIRLREGLIVVALEVQYVPCDVRQDCLQIERQCKGKPQSWF